MQDIGVSLLSRNQSRDTKGVPDRLIVAARHREVTLLLVSLSSACCEEYAASPQGCTVHSVKVLKS